MSQLDEEIEPKPLTEPLLNPGPQVEQNGRKIFQRMKKEETKDYTRFKKLERAQMKEKIEQLQEWSETDQQLTNQERHEINLILKKLKKIYKEAKFKDLKKFGAYVGVILAVQAYDCVSNQFDRQEGVSGSCVGCGASLVCAIILAIIVFCRD